MRSTLFLLAFVAAPLWAQDEAAKSLLQTFWEFPDRPEFQNAVLSMFKEEDLVKGAAVAGYGEDFIFAIQTPSVPQLSIDGRKPTSMRRIRETNLWAAPARLKAGQHHWFSYMIDGKKFGGKTDLAAYLPDSYQQEGVPKGKLHGPFVHTSKLYDGMTSEYWVYVPAQYDASKPAALMFWHDGQGLVKRDSASRLQIVNDNLTHKKLMPVTIHVLVAPGTLGGKPMRSILYDTVSDKHARMLRDELLPEVQAKWNIRKDAYSRAVAGGSSGGISSFNIAWQQPDQFSRVHSQRGSFASIQWKPGAQDGGDIYPFAVRKQPKRNIRVWLQDGSNDLENRHGSWPLQNIQLANSLKLRGYDFHFSYGEGTHDNAHGNAELPISLQWLWRGYDPAKTSEEYAMDPAEKDKPYFRARIYNRDHWKNPDHAARPKPDFAQVKFTDDDVKSGKAVFADGAHYMLAVESKTKPVLMLDEQPGPDMKQTPGTDVWTYAGEWQTGRTHNFHYVVDAKRFGGKTDVIAYGPDSYEQPGVPKGTWSGKLAITSKLYDGLTLDYWVYTPPQYSPSTPAALMIWHDGEAYSDPRSPSRASIVIDNLTYQKKMPPAVHVFVSPLVNGKNTHRADLYDTVTDKHARFFRDELLPEVYKSYNVRRDAYSRATLGESSGGISAFNIAWQQPNQFSRVVCRIGTFESIRWKPGELEGGNVYPFKVRKEPKKNLRVWLYDGSEDLENQFGSWPLQNIQMANSLKMGEYDIHLNYTNGTHTRSGGHAELPEELTWIWRGYDPAKTSEEFVMDPAEKDKPLYRVRIYNR